MSNRVVTGSLVAGGALLAAVGASTAVALGSTPAVSVPSVSVPSISVPSVSVASATVPAATVPAATVPSATVPSVTLGPATTPRVTTPQVTTPPVSTPGISTPPATTPLLPVKTPAGGASHSGAPSSGAADSRAASPRSGASQASGAPALGSTSASGTGSGRASRGGSAGSSASSRAPARTSAGGAARHAATRRVTRSTLGTVGSAIALAASRRGQATSAGSGSALATRAAAPAHSNGPFVRLVKELPTAVLFALLAFGVVAAAMALNAYLQSRRARSLAGQRAALLSDVGVLQAALLPAVPATVGDLNISVAYRPAQGLAAGGDFFDVFTVSAGRTGIIIGDVSGHGRESLIHAALVRYTLRTLMGEGHSLPEVLARADRYLTGELGEGFATVIVCIYEHATGELTWAKAGHEPPILAGQPDAEEQAATPLGFGLGDTWPQFSRCLAAGERVCLFTDGLIEARRQGEHLGRAHLRSLVEQGFSAQDLVERVQSDSDDCSDDLAAVVISRAATVAEVGTTPAPEAAAVA